jgi:hypothetical protein
MGMVKGSDFKVQNCTTNLVKKINRVNEVMVQDPSF